MDNTEASRIIPMTFVKDKKGVAHLKDYATGKGQPVKDIIELKKSNTRLEKKIITNKLGNKRTVWVKKQDN